MTYKIQSRIIKQCRSYLFILIALIAVQSCKQKPEQLAFKVFNEGVKLSLDATEVATAGDFEKATDLNEEAIKKFKETISIDSTHKIARSALAHCLYLNKKYDEAIQWFEQANRIYPQAINYQEMGLCRINKGDVIRGKKDIYTALKLDPSDEFKENTTENIYDIGKLAFEYSKTYLDDDQKETALTYQNFSIDVLKLALEISPNRKDIKNSLDDTSK